jgi:putative membrane protein
MFWHEHMNTGGWVFMVLGNIVVWGLIFAFILWLMQDWRTRQRHRESASGPSIAEILDTRLASGEIDTDEYQRLRNTLGQPPRPQPPRIDEPQGKA